MPERINPDRVRSSVDRFLGQRINEGLLIRGPSPELELAVQTGQYNGVNHRLFYGGVIASPVDMLYGLGKLAERADMLSLEGAGEVMLAHAALVLYDHNVTKQRLQ